MQPKVHRDTKGHGQGRRGHPAAVGPPLAGRVLPLGTALLEMLGRIRLLPTDQVHPGLLHATQQLTTGMSLPSLTTKLLALGASCGNEVHVLPMLLMDKRFFSQFQVSLLFPGQLSVSLVSQGR